LLSDGNANSGLTDGKQIAGQCAELARTGVTTSTYGLGRGFNEELMIDMARHGKGHSYYGSTASDLMDPFREEFALLNATCARNLRLELATSAGVSATPLNDYVVAGSRVKCRARGGYPIWRTPARRGPCCGSGSPGSASMRRRRSPCSASRSITWVSMASRVRSRARR
jgi:hypothetical protein